MRKSIIIFLFLWAISANAQDKQLQKQLKGLDSYIEQTLKDWNVPGVGLGIVKNGKVIYAKGFGYSDVEKQKAVTPMTLFAIGSSSKAFTSATVCKLADDEKLELDKPVRTYMPDFELYDKFATEQMTARDLLCHRSGLPRHDIVWYGSSKNRAELYKTLKYLEPTQDFRAAWQYQNLMFMTAGYLVERVAGMTWEAYTKKNFFDPLEMKNSNFSVEEMQKAKDFAFPYKEAEDKLVKMDFRNIDAIGPAGSINSNVMDMCNWLKMQLNGGKYNGEQIVSADMVRQMHAPTMIMPGGVSDEVFYRTYGLGWMITSYRGHLRVEHGGNIDGFSANVGLFPRDSIGIVVLTNMNGTGLTGVIRNYVIDRLLDMEEIDWSARLLKDINKAKEAQEVAEEEEEDASQVKNTSPSHKLADYAGIYTHEAYGKMDIQMKDDKLVLHIRTFELPLHHYHYDIFQIDDELLGKQKFAFHTNLDGEIHQVSSEMEAGVKHIYFERKPKDMELSAESLQMYVGEYELQGMKIKIGLKKETTLTMTVPGQPEYTLVPFKEHIFKLKGLDGFKVIFKLDDAGKVEALVSSQPNGDFKAKRI